MQDCNYALQSVPHDLAVCSLHVETMLTACQLALLTAWTLHLKYWCTLNTSCLLFLEKYDSDSYGIVFSWKYSKCNCKIKMDFWHWKHIMAWTKMDSSTFRHWINLSWYVLFTWWISTKLVLTHPQIIKLIHIWGLLQTTGNLTQSHWHRHSSRSVPCTGCYCNHCATTAWRPEPFSTSVKKLNTLKSHGDSSRLYEGLSSTFQCTGCSMSWTV
jgi:hypothetical protein